MIMRYFITTSLCAAMALMTVPTWAQNAASPVSPATQAAQVRANQPASNPGIADDKTTGTSIRASQLTGMNIVNSSGDSVGKIHDIVIDSQSGQVQYVAVTYGGFLGFGDKLFAVPYEAFQYRVDPNDRNDHALVLNVTKEQMEGAQGFDQDNWPNFADQKFTADLDRRYRVERRGPAGRRGVDVNINRQGVDVDVNRPGVDVNRRGVDVDVNRRGVDVDVKTQPRN